MVSAAAPLQRASVEYLSIPNSSYPSPWNIPFEIHSQVMREQNKKIVPSVRWPVYAREDSFPRFRKRAMIHSSRHSRNASSSSFPRIIATRGRGCGSGGSPPVWFTPGGRRTGATGFVLGACPTVETEVLLLIDPTSTSTVFEGSSLTDAGSRDLPSVVSVSSSGIEDAAATFSTVVLRRLESSLRRSLPELVLQRSQPPTRLKLPNVSVNGSYLALLLGAGFSLPRRTRPGLKDEPLCDVAEAVAAVVTGPECMRLAMGNVG